jgi:hypothetical protein
MSYKHIHEYISSPNTPEFPYVIRIKTPRPEYQTHDLSVGTIKDLTSWLFACNDYRARCVSTSEQLLGYSKVTGNYEMFFVWFKEHNDLIQFKLVI